MKRSLVLREFGVVAGVLLVFVIACAGLIWSVSGFIASYEPETRGRFAKGDIVVFKINGNQARIVGNEKWFIGEQEWRYQVRMADGTKIEVAEHEIVALSMESEEP